jgi:hypothetical protein
LIEDLLYPELALFLGYSKGGWQVPDKRCVVIDDLAIAWVAEQFDKAGLRPVLKDAVGKPSFLQPLMLVEYRPDRAASSITMTRNGKETVWHAPQVSGHISTASM